MKEVPILDIPIFHKLYALYTLLHSYQKSIPKAERYTLWQKCENSLLEIFELLLETDHLKGEARLLVLYRISHRVDLLKILIRLAKDIRVLNPSRYLEIQTHLQEVGRMIGGWIKSVPR